MAVVDDHTVVRGAYVDLLNQWPRGQVVLDAANGVDYELRSQETGPIDIVLMDLQMPHRDGFQTTRWIRQHQRNTRVLGLSHDPTVADARELLRLGALGLLP
ncbi:MAG: response regulator transcription factor, partial [Flavobacteriales bacterium]|nr:response regulator transcription factor [Flavobacteriales bacterium]